MCDGQKIDPKREMFVSSTNPTGQTNAEDERSKPKKQCSSEKTVSKFLPDMNEEGPFIPECEMVAEGTSYEELYKSCTKNHGHIAFTPVSKFLSDPLTHFIGFSVDAELKNAILADPITYGVDWLPDEQTMFEMQELVHVLSPITNRVVTTSTSKERPDYFPGTMSPYPFFEERGKSGMIRYATGTLVTPLIPFEGVCLCSICEVSKKPMETFWLGLVLTATHGVCNVEEARNSTFDFFYDDEKEKQTIYGTDVSISTFIHVIRYITHYRIYYDQLLRLKELTKHPFASDMNVIVCATHDEKTAADLSSAWTEWAKYKKTLSQPRLDVIEKCSLIVSHPHGGPKVASFGNAMEFSPLSLKDCIQKCNVYLEKQYTDRGGVEKCWRRRYVVSSETENDLFLLYSHLYPPFPFDGDSDLVCVGDTVTIPARTKVVTRDGAKTCYCLRKDEVVPGNCLQLLTCYTEVDSVPTPQRGDRRHSAENSGTGSETKSTSSSGLYNICYFVPSNSPNELLPDWCKVFPPRVLDRDSLLPDTDLVRLPAKTEVWIIEGFSMTRYSLWRETQFPLDSLKVTSTCYWKYDTPTCPGSSGALLPFIFLYYNDVSTHSGACRNGINKSGIKTV